VAGNFLQQIKKRQEAAERPAPEQEPTQPVEQMTDAEGSDAA